MNEQLTLELAATHAPVYPEGANWKETARYLYENEPERMEELRESIKKYGFREPIALSIPEELSAGEQPRVLDGTHRFVIALLEGMVSIPTEFISERNARENSNEPQVQLSITTLTEDFTEDEEDRLIERLSSWKLDEERWVTSSNAFGDRKSWSFVLDSADLNDAPLIRKRASQILKGILPKRKLRLLVLAYED